MPITTHQCMQLRGPRDIASTEMVAEVGEVCIGLSDLPSRALAGELVRSYPLLRPFQYCQRRTGGARDDVIIFKV